MGGEPNNRASHNQISQREPGSAGDCLDVEASEFAEKRGAQRKQYSSGKHLGRGTHGFYGGQRQLAGKSGGPRPNKRGHDQGTGAGSVNRNLSEAQGAAHEHRDSTDSYEKSHRQAGTQVLRPQDKDLRHCHEHGNRGHHDGSETGGYALLSPEEQSVIEDKDQDRKQ